MIGAHDLVEVNNLVKRNLEESKKCTRGLILNINITPSSFNEVRALGGSSYCMVLE